MAEVAVGSVRAYPGIRRVSIREAQKQLTRDRLISAAIEVMVERGFDAATIDEIASHANVGRTTLYSYFHGKQDFAIAIGEYMELEVLRAFTDMKRIQPGNLKDLNAWFDSYATRVAALAPAMSIVPVSHDSLTHSLHDQDAAAEEILAEWAQRGWVAHTAAPSQSLRLLFNLVGRWLSYHSVYDVPEPEHSREALLELVNSEIRRIVRRAHT
ncbi:MAG: TetR/AcrR family transcriptional regulator [Actinomycetota bacterium]|nr:TetR/AcrR family transcriptional regulator [Actinomycetota bacterium]